MESLQKHWANAVTLGCILIAALIEAWQQAAASLPSNASVPRLHGVWNYVPLILLTVAGIVWLTGRRKSADQSPPQTPQPPSVVPGIPSLSALLGQNPNVQFDAKRFFALAYYSPVTAEIEKNIKIIAQQNSPSDKEAFYARFIGVGAVAYQHDVTWLTVYGSQMAAMAEMNSRGLIPVADVKKHYDKVAADHPNYYARYSFEQWMDYMQSRMLIARYPSGMVELSFNGKDFLRYLAHTGMSASGKAY